METVMNFVLKQPNTEELCKMICEKVQESAKEYTEKLAATEAELATVKRNFEHNKFFTNSFEQQRNQARLDLAKLTERAEKAEKELKTRTLQREDITASYASLMLQKKELEGRVKNQLKSIDNLCAEREHRMKETSRLKEELSEARKGCDEGMLCMFKHDYLALEQVRVRLVDDLKRANGRCEGEHSALVRKCKELSECEQERNRTKQELDELHVVAGELRDQLKEATIAGAKNTIPYSIYEQTACRAVQTDAKLTIAMEDLAEQKALGKKRRERIKAQEECIEELKTELGRSNVRAFMVDGLPFPKEKQIEVLTDMLRMVNGGTMELTSAVCSSKGFNIRSKMVPVGKVAPKSKLLADMIDKDGNINMDMVNAGIVAPAQTPQQLADEGLEKAGEKSGKAKTSLESMEQLKASIMSEMKPLVDKIARETIFSGSLPGGMLNQRGNLFSGGDVSNPLNLTLV